MVKRKPEMYPRNRQVHEYDTGQAQKFHVPQAKSLYQKLEQGIPVSEYM